MPEKPVRCLQAESDRCGGSLQKEEVQRCLHLGIVFLGGDQRPDGDTLGQQMR